MNNYPISNHRQMRKIQPRQTPAYRAPSVLSNYVNRLAQFREDLEITRHIFDRDEIWPDQRDYVINTFEATQRVLGGFAKTINSKKPKAKLSGHHRYAALTNAYHVSEQIDKSICAIREINLNQQRKSSKRSKIKEVRESLRKLDSSFNDLMQGLDKLIKNL